jgi:hypothetical protein
MKRRKFLVSTLASAASVPGLGCSHGGSGAGGPPAAQATAPATALAAQSATVWKPPPIVFPAGGDSSIDLALTLPAGVRRGGTFGLAPHSAPLPPQVTLSPKGILRASGAPVSLTENVIFTYQEPD